VASVPTVDSDSDSTNHGTTFGIVYANELALTEIGKDRPAFPVGSILVREKNILESSSIPQTVIAMVKRENGFSRETNDWEFFLFGGKMMNLNSRETVGSCSNCHSAAAKTDWVFLKDLRKD
jgi:hypothetical protein